MKFTIWDQDDSEDLELIGFVEVTIQNLIDKIESKKPFIKKLKDNAPKKERTNVGVIKIFPKLLTEKKKAATVTNNILASFF